MLIIIIMKTTFTKIVLFTIFISTAIMANACQKQLSENSLQEQENQSNKTSDLSGNLDVTPSTNFVATSNLSEDEIAGLIFMKEEEKLARDVYSFLYTKWNAKIFNNISSSENTHANAIISLLKFYNNPDTTLQAVGLFNNKELQDLYTNLISKGSISLVEAYKIGALIEDLDISDLENYINNTKNINIISVLENLQKGSRNHIRSFTKQLNNLGVIYIPTYISQIEYNSIIASDMERGND